MKISHNKVTNWIIAFATLVLAVVAIMALRKDEKPVSIQTNQQLDDIGVGIGVNNGDITIPTFDGRWIIEKIACCQELALLELQNMIEMDIGVPLGIERPGHSNSSACSQFIKSSAFDPSACCDKQLMQNYSPTKPVWLINTDSGLSIIQYGSRMQKKIKVDVYDVVSKGGTLNFKTKQSKKFYNRDAYSETIIDYFISLESPTDARGHWSSVTTSIDTVAGRQIYCDQGVIIMYKIPN